MVFQNWKKNVIPLPNLHWEIVKMKKHSMQSERKRNKSQWKKASPVCRYMIYLSMCLYVHLSFPQIYHLSMEQSSFIISI